ncbi:hypothetical protein C8R43DRAFT_854759, partial [Mycena crocata]
QLIPHYIAIGCKRLLIDAGYRASLHRPNVFLDWDGIESTYDEGLVTKTGQIVHFASYRMLLTTPTYFGRRDTTVRCHNAGDWIYFGVWQPLSIQIPGFPNLFLISGPNTGTGSTSVISFQECQVCAASQ